MPIREDIPTQVMTTDGRRNDGRLVGQPDDIFVSGETQEDMGVKTERRKETEQTWETILSRDARTAPWTGRDEAVRYYQMSTKDMIDLLKTALFNGMSEEDRHRLGAEDDESLLRLIAREEVDVQNYPTKEWIRFAVMNVNGTIHNIRQGLYTSSSNAV